MFGLEQDVNVEWSITDVSDAKKVLLICLKKRTVGSRQYRALFSWLLRVAKLASQIIRVHRPHV